MRIQDYIDRNVGIRGDRVALIDGDRRYSWREVDELTSRIASALVSRGLGQGSRVAVLSRNDARAFIVLLGLLRAGAAWVPVNFRNSIDANQHWLSLVAANCLFYHSAEEESALTISGVLSAPALRICIDREGPQSIPSLDSFIKTAGPRIPEVPNDNDRAFIYFPTGGTTDLSKAVIYTGLVFETMSNHFWRLMPAAKDMVHLCAGPMTHAAGGLALITLAEGGTNVILQRPDPLRILEEIAVQRVTHLYLPPTLIYAILDHPRVGEFDLGSLEYLVVTAAPIAPSRFEQAMKVFNGAVCQAYGQAEAPAFLTFLSSKELRSPELNADGSLWKSCGRSTLHTILQIVDEDDKCLGAGEKGEIVVRSNLVSPGYLNKPEATALVQRGGWLHTGDIGYRDDRGFVYIVDRKKDMIVTGGFNVYSAEIEAVIMRHPSVRECAVIGVPDERWGEAVKAVVELAEGATLIEAELVALVREQLGSVNAPKSIEVWDVLPRTPAGKVLKRAIREHFWKGHDRAVS
jgi:acyl-CoA synthetase (AMP-forming)/AMP-acid ligase II